MYSVCITDNFHDIAYAERNDLPALALKAHKNSFGRLCTYFAADVRGESESDAVSVVHSDRKVFDTVVFSSCAEILFSSRIACIGSKA